MEERAPLCRMGTSAPARQDLWGRTVNLEANVSQIHVAMEARAMTQDKVTNAHAPKASEETTVKNKTSVIPIPAEMEARVRESMKEKALNARAEKDLREKTVKNSTFVSPIRAKMGQHAQKEQVEDMNARVLLATKALRVKKEVFVFLTPVCMEEPVLMRRTATDAAAEQVTVASTANITCASRIPARMVDHVSRKVRPTDACAKWVTMETDANC